MAETQRSIDNLLTDAYGLAKQSLESLRDRLLPAVINSTERSFTEPDSVAASGPHPDSWPARQSAARSASISAAEKIVERTISQAPAMPARSPSSDVLMSS